MGKGAGRITDRLVATVTEINWYTDSRKTLRLPSGKRPTLFLSWGLFISPHNFELGDDKLMQRLLGLKTREKEILYFEE